MLPHLHYIKTPPAARGAPGGPGIAEEALFTLQVHRPLYIVGGFGGCARDIAEMLEMIEPLHSLSRPPWESHEAFAPYRVHSLNNGLTYDENRTLAKTPHIRQAVGLILRGLDRTRSLEENA